MPVCTSTIAGERWLLPVPLLRAFSGGPSRECPACAPLTTALMAETPASKASQAAGVPILSSASNATLAALQASSGSTAASAATCQVPEPYPATCGTLGRRRSGAAAANRRLTLSSSRLSCTTSMSCRGGPFGWKSPSSGWSGPPRCGTVTSPLSNSSYSQPSRHEVHPST